MSEVPSDCAVERRRRADAAEVPRSAALSNAVYVDSETVSVTQPDNNVEHRT